VFLQVKYIEVRIVSFPTRQTVFILVTRAKTQSLLEIHDAIQRTLIKRACDTLNVLEGKVNNHGDRLIRPTAGYLIARHHYRLLNLASCSSQKFLHDRCPQ
jgi:hypothetical protein